MGWRGGDEGGDGGNGGGGESGDGGDGESGDEGGGESGGMKGYHEGGDGGGGNPSLGPHPTPPLTQASLPSTQASLHFPSKTLLTQPKPPPPPQVLT